jgi:hypothetical protein
MLFLGLLPMSGLENVLKNFCIMLLNYYLVYILCCEKNHKTRWSKRNLFILAPYKRICRQSAPSD